MKAERAMVIAVTPEGKIPQALTTMLPIDEAVKAFADHAADEARPGAKKRPELRLRDDAGRDLDPKTGEIPEKTPAAGPGDPAEPAKAAAPSPAKAKPGKS